MSIIEIYSKFNKSYLQNNFFLNKLPPFKHGFITELNKKFKKPNHAMCQQKSR